MKKFNRGFTLIELLVVIFIIGLLASIVVVSVNSARSKARDTKRKADIKSFKTAIELYANDNGRYPSVGADNLGYNVSLLATPLTTFLNPIPNDPKAPTQYYYYVRGPEANNSYALLVTFENILYGTSHACKTGSNINTAWWGVAVPICTDL